MALTVGESLAVNGLLDWLAGDPPRITDREAMEAAAVLADKAHKTLLTGLNGERVRKLWPKVITARVGRGKARKGGKLRK